VVATQGRTIHRGTSGGLGPMLRRQVDPRQRTPPAACVASGQPLRPMAAIPPKAGMILHCGI
jgi:hypothetical protein